MKTASINFEACDKKPLEIFADMPGLLSTMHKLQDALYTTLFAGITPTNFKRAGTIIDFAHHLQVHINQGLNMYAKEIAFSLQLEINAHQDDPMQPDQLTTQEVDRMTEYIENCDYMSMYMSEQETVQYYTENIMKYYAALLSEHTFTEVMNNTYFTTAQKLHIVERLLQHLEKILAYTASQEQEIVVTNQQLKEKLDYCLNEGVISLDSYHDFYNELPAEEKIESIQNDNLLFYHLLLQKKRELVGEHVCVD